VVESRGVRSTLVIRLRLNNANWDEIR
jgi:hypothetical protein